MKRSCTSGPVLVKPQASVSLRPSTISGMPGSWRRRHWRLPPRGCSSARCARYQIAGAPSRRCGSLASSGLPDLRARARHHPVVGGAAADQVVDAVRRCGPPLRRRWALQRIELRELGHAAAARSAASSGIRSSISAEFRPCAASASRSISWLRLVRELQRHQLDGDDAVGRLPRLGPMPQQQELRRQPRLEQPGAARHEGVDAARVGLERRACASGGSAAKRALGVAVEVERAQEHVGGEGALAEDLRQAALAGAALQLHLPQPVLRVHEAERDVEVVDGLGEDVRHALAVAHHLDGLRQARRWRASPRAPAPCCAAGRRPSPAANASRSTITPAAVPAHLRTRFIAPTRPADF